MTEMGEGVGRSTTRYCSAFSKDEALRFIRCTASKFSEGDFSNAGKYVRLAVFSVTRLNDGHFNWLVFTAFEDLTNQYL